MNSSVSLNKRGLEIYRSTDGKLYKTLPQIPKDVHHITFFILVQKAPECYQSHTSTSFKMTSTPLHSNQKLFSPLRIGSLTLSHRIILSPLTRIRCPNGLPTPLVAEYYSQRATIGGLLISEGIHRSLMVCLFCILSPSLSSFVGGVRVG